VKFSGVRGWRVNQDSIAEFQSEYSRYWEYVEDTGAGTGEDTQTDTSVSR